MMIRSTTLSTVLFLGGAAGTFADGPRDNLPNAVRRIPPLGIVVSAEDRKALEAGLAELETAIGRLEARRERRISDLLPDVKIFSKAVHDALAYQEFFSPADVTKAKDLLKVGHRRAEQLQEGSAPWTLQAGLVVRGYISRIDGSVQPYGLVIPGSDAPDAQAMPDVDTLQGPGPFRLDVWFHGRGEILSEVNFLDEHRRQRGLFTPAETIVLHPYGRYCNAFKFAGEVDVLEAIEAVRRNYRVDDDRISVRGFSMGGAACWQFAVHYADRWFAANPGAGFAETPRFLRLFQNETLKPPAYEKALWHLYDCTDYAVNLLGCPTVAYSGELDSQKQAADVMAEALRQEGIELMHVIGPGTKHQYHPDAKREVDRRMESLAARGRQKYPLEVTLVTYTLKYNRMYWITIDAVEEHWKRARVKATPHPGGVTLETENVRALTLEFPPGWSPFKVNAAVGLVVDRHAIRGPRPLSDRSWRCQLHRVGEKWEVGPQTEPPLRKRHDLQGPIDDAFMDSFVFVRPGGTSANGRLQAWVKSESDRAVEHWRRQFRGDARVKKDSEISDGDIASSNLVLWGDPESNAVLKRVADKLPISWNKDRIKVGSAEYSSADHALVLIYPNPLNPRRYVVLNSGFTFRDYDYLNNARQVPKLPDWAVIDLRTPPDSQHPGNVVQADFFGEAWEVRTPRASR